MRLRRCPRLPRAPLGVPGTARVWAALWGLAAAPAGGSRVAVWCACQRFTMNVPNSFPQAVLGDRVCLDTCWITVRHPIYASKFCKISSRLSFLFLEKLPDASLLFCKTSCILPICFPPCFSGGKLNVHAHFKYSLNISDRLEVKSKSFSQHRADRKFVHRAARLVAQCLVMGVEGPPGHHSLEWHRLGGKRSRNLHTVAGKGMFQGFSQTSW